MSCLYSSASKDCTCWQFTFRTGSPTTLIWEKMRKRVNATGIKMEWGINGNVLITINPRVSYLFQFLHVQRLVQVQTSVLVLCGCWVDEPLQKPLEAQEQKLWKKTQSSWKEIWKRTFVIPGTSPYRSLRWRQSPRSPVSERRSAHRLQRCLRSAEKQKRGVNGLTSAPLFFIANTRNNSFYWPHQNEDLLEEPS